MENKQSKGDFYLTEQTDRQATTEIFDILTRRAREMETTVTNDRLLIPGIEPIPLDNIHSVTMTLISIEILCCNDTLYRFDRRIREFSIVLPPKECPGLFSILCFMCRCLWERWRSNR